jgi:hypothetical protein
LPDLAIHIDHQGVRLRVRSASIPLHLLIHLDRLLGASRLQQPVEVRVVYGCAWKEETISS